jgi:hypothetical protein
MTCLEFVECFSEVYDGTASAEAVRAAEEHLAGCASCRRYRRVVERGADVLRTLPGPLVSDDFAPRLAHQLRYEDPRAVLLRHANSGATAIAVVGMALVLLAVAWAPTLRSAEPTIELPPIVVSAPPELIRTRSLASFTAFAPQPTATAVETDLWGDAPTLFFQYSRLARRYGQHPLAEAGDVEQSR